RRPQWVRTGARLLAGLRGARFREPAAVGAGRRGDTAPGAPRPGGRQRRGRERHLRRGNDRRGARFPALAPAARRWTGRPLAGHRPLPTGGHLPAADARHARGNVVTPILDALKKVEAIERRPLELPPSPRRPPTSRRIGVAVAIVLAAALGLALWFRSAPH